LVGNLEVKRPTGNLRHRCRYDIKEMRCDGVDWIHPPPDMYHMWALVNMVMSLWVPKMAGEYLY
jgi:hypothetical protein